MDETITINGMVFECTHLIPNFIGKHDTNPCDECDLNISWVDYGTDDPCKDVKGCAGKCCKSHDVYSIRGGVDNLKQKQ